MLSLGWDESVTWQTTIHLHVLDHKDLGRSLADILLNFFIDSSRMILFYWSQTLLKCFDVLCIRPYKDLRLVFVYKVKFSVMLILGCLLKYAVADGLLLLLDGWQVFYAVNKVINGFIYACCLWLDCIVQMILWRSFFVRLACDAIKKTTSDIIFICLMRNIWSFRSFWLQGFEAAWLL